MTNYTLTAAKGTFAQTGSTHQPLRTLALVELEAANTAALTAFSPINLAEKGLSPTTLTKQIRWHRDYRW